VRLHDAVEPACAVGTGGVHRLLEVVARAGLVGELEAVVRSLSSFEVISALRGELVPAVVRAEDDARPSAVETL
jgi:hypothetical protein